MMKFSFPSTFIIPCSVFCGSLFYNALNLLTAVFSQRCQAQNSFELRF